MRKRPLPKFNFKLKLINYRRVDAEFKNLKYKKILSHLSKVDNSKTDIALIYKKKILETGTSNLLFTKDNKVFTSKKDCYEGNTFKFLKTKIKKIVKKDIFIKDINKFDEIILVGSGKGVASVKTIHEIGWKRKSLYKFKIFSKYYHSAIKKCNSYKF